MRPDPTWGDEHADLTTAGEPEIDPGPIRLVLVEPSSIHGAAVRELLDREDDFEVVAEVRTTDEAVSVTMAQPPDVLVVDGNPLDNIRTLLDPLLVISNGRLALDRLTFGR